jgi:hypothetical protein
VPSDLFPGILTRILYAFLIAPIRTTCPAHLILLDHLSTHFQWGTTYGVARYSCSPPSCFIIFALMFILTALEQDRAFPECDDVLGCDAVWTHR